MMDVGFIGLERWDVQWLAILGLPDISCFFMTSGRCRESVAAGGVVCKSGREVGGRIDVVIVSGAGYA
jgi:hypothetical protein